jgi:hypothetical protein
MKVKTDKGKAADLRFLRPEITRFLFNIEQIVLWHCPWMEEVTITSGNDGKHLKRSKHYRNQAIDIRTWGNNPNFVYIDDFPSAKNSIIADLGRLLGEDYQIVWHNRDHLHIEWDP